MLLISTDWRCKATEVFTLSEEREENIQNWLAFFKMISPLKMLIHYIFSGDSDLSSLEEFKNLHLNDQKRFKELFPEYAHLFE